MSRWTTGTHGGAPVGEGLGGDAAAERDMFPPEAGNGLFMRVAPLVTCVTISFIEFASGFGENRTLVVCTPA